MQKEERGDLARDPCKSYHGKPSWGNLGLLFKEATELHSNISPKFRDISSSSRKPSWMGRLVCSCSLLWAPSPRCRCHPLASDKAGTSSGSSQADSVAFKKQELPGA